MRLENESHVEENTFPVEVICSIATLKDLIHMGNKKEVGVTITAQFRENYTEKVRESDSSTGKCGKIVMRTVPEGMVRVEIANSLGLMNL
jgi:hypothetical protein